VAVVTVQSTVGLRTSHPVPTRELLDQIRELFARQRIRSIKIGALGSLGNVVGVTRLLRKRSGKIPVVIDPVMRSSRVTGRARLLDNGAERALWKMCELATVVTPNVPEAEHFVSGTIRSLSDAEGAARALVDTGARAALVKGGHLAATGNGHAVDVLAVGGRIFRFGAPRVRGAIHGTGCTLASLIAGYLAHHDEVDDEAIVTAVRKAKQRLETALQRPLRIGPGQLVLAP
jgi:hydroxymethylpyrimidine/phosphomethylpyrimidine kinase